ncbi:MAG: recombinase zinc beta ribbon domain-containing protein, partial [Eubacterium sp.]|nr:recombinase zinc beta ribbon domain-containing protein [Eubacterium sp.]
RCGDCGQNMVRRSVRKNEKQYFYYHCSTFKSGEGCSSHNISDVTLQKVVLNAIRNQIALIVKADAIIAQIENIPQQQFGIKVLDTQMKALGVEIQKYKDLKSNLYQDMIDGIITREEYRDIKQTFSQKIETAEESVRELERKKKRMLSNEMRTQKWVEEFKQCQNIKTLDRKVAVMLLNRIVVYSSDRIEIHFNNEDEIKELVEYALEHEDEIQGKVEVV